MRMSSERETEHEAERMTLINRENKVENDRLIIEGRT